MKSGHPLPTVDPSKASHSTSLGFTTTADHAHLGHFKQEKFLREGHNTVGGYGSKRAKTRAVASVLSSGKVGVSRQGKAGKSIVVAKAAENLGRRTARKAIKAGGAIGAAVAAAKPKLAKRIARRAGATVRTSA